MRLKAILQIRSRLHQRDYSYITDCPLNTKFKVEDSERIITVLERCYDENLDLIYYMVDDPDFSYIQRENKFVELFVYPENVTLGQCHRLSCAMEQRRVARMGKRCTLQIPIASFWKNMAKQSWNGLKRKKQNHI